ncbi:MAG TPA: hypothetical protein ENK62_08690 [Chromatiales bacterium]|nr:hypothetical protein [Chromatiales bacterium]
MSQRGAGRKAGEDGVRFFLFALGVLLVMSGPLWAATSSLRARDDTANVRAGGQVRIDVLANDRGVQRNRAKVKVVQRPKRGTAFVTTNKQVVYKAPKGFKGQVTFVYRVQDPRGRRSTAKVTVRVRCSSCSVANNGTGGGSARVRARNDVAKVQAGKRVRIDVLANDRGVQRSRAKVKVVQRPKRGVAFVTSTNKVLYEAPKGFSGKETFVYQVRDRNGRKSTATVTVQVACPGCANAGSGGGSGGGAPKQVRLSWDPAGGPVDRYEVLFGTKPANTQVPVATVPPLNGNTARQMVALELGTDVPAGVGDRVCFRVRAVASGGLSSESESRCTVIQ